MIPRSSRVDIRAIRFLAIPVIALAIFLGLRPGTDAASTGADAPPLVEAVSSEAALPPGSAAMIARIDAETGVVGVASGETPLALDPETLNALSRSTEGLVPVTHPDGSVSVNLQGRFQSASVARISADGKVIVCLDHDEHAAAALNRPVESALEVQ